MKNYLLIKFCLASMLFLFSCDKIDNPFPPSINVDLDTTIYPGNWSDYVANEWPDFSTILDVNPNRNALIEDFTGHNCNNCPAAAAVAHTIYESNPTRVFIAGIHASNTVSGSSSFQTVNLAAGYTVDFTNPNGLALGSYFGVTLANSGFFGNPAGTINRTSVDGEYFSASGTWSSRVNGILSSTLKVRIKSKLNYYESPKKGFFLHTEIEKLDPLLTNELGIVTYLIEDSLVAPQNVNNVLTNDYVHRDIFRGTLDGLTWGQTLNPDMMLNNRYYVNYSYLLPDQLFPVNGTTTGHNPSNMHILIYVYDKITLEILQVIKQKIE
jgi:hypothetical protein